MNLETLLRKNNLILTNDTSYYKVGNGWISIIESLIKKLLLLGWNGQIEQIKEKFGGLRWYIVPDPTNKNLTQIYHCIDDAEMLSFTVCEICSLAGKPCQVKKTSGWVKTLCDTCKVAVANAHTNFNFDKINVLFYG